MNTKRNYIGETRIMNNGLKATIIAKRSYRDIDVQFEDGTIVKNRTYINFKNGRISNSVKRTKIPIGQYVGRTKVMNNGLKAMVIEEESGKNLTIQFEDGTIVYNKTRTNFDRGNVRNPNITSDKIQKINRMRNGLKASIICDRGCGDIDVQFEDGYVVEHKARSSFKRRTIKYMRIDIIQKLLLEHETSLKPRDYEIMNLRYGLIDGEIWTFKKLGNKFNISGERVRVIVNESLEKMGLDKFGRRN